jgi:hypothetical protein
MPFRFRPDNASNHESVFRACPDEMDGGNDPFQALFDPEWYHVRVSDVGDLVKVSIGQMRNEVEGSESRNLREETGPTDIINNIKSSVFAEWEQSRIQQV